MLRVRFVRPCARVVLGAIAPSGLLWGCLLALLLSGVACKKTEPAGVVPRVTRIRIAGLQDGVDPENDPRLAQLIDAAGRGLRQAGVQVQLQPPTAQAADFHLRLQLQVQTAAVPAPTSPPSPPSPASPTPPAGLRLRLLCAGELRAPASLLSEPDDRPGKAPVLELSKFDHVGMMERDLANEPTAPEVLALLLRLVEDSTATLGGELSLLRSDSRELMARVAKSDGDPALRGTAIQILGRRRERLAIPVLTALIKETGTRRRERLLTKRGPAATGTETGTGTDAGDADAQKAQAQAQAQAQRQLQDDQILSVLRDTAIGALIEIGDRSAVRPLLDSVAFLDRVEMGKIVEAVATLGGDEARNYLRFVSSSHPDAAMRKDAAAALARLERREGEPSKPAAP